MRTETAYIPATSKTKKPFYVVEA